MFASIVVAFDGSVYSSKALEVAAGLAARDGIPLGIVYVVDASHMTITQDMREMGEIEHIIDPMPQMLVNFRNAPPLLVSSMAQAAVESDRAMIQYADFLLQQAEQSARQQGAEQIDAKMMRGKPAEEIARFASECKADLIVVGSRGFGKLKSLLLGSTSQQVAQIADCSCLTVR